MFGTSLFGTALFGTGPTSLYTVTPYDFEYNGYEFGGTSTIFKISDVPDLESAKAINADTYEIALSNGSGLNGYTLKPKKVYVEGILIASTASLLETYITQLKYAVLQPQQTLRKTLQNGVVIEGIASCTMIEIPRKPYHITYVPVKIEFTVFEGLMYDTVVNEASSFANTANFTGTAIVDDGEWEVSPILYFTVNSATSVTAISITLNDQTITITRAFSASDMIIINSKTKQVTINSVSGQDYVGEFPVMGVGSNYYSVDVTGSAFNVDLVIQWYDTYV